MSDWKTGAIALGTQDDSKGAAENEGLSEGLRPN